MTQKKEKVYCTNPSSSKLPSFRFGTGKALDQIFLCPPWCVERYPLISGGNDPPNTFLGEADSWRCWYGIQVDCVIIVVYQIHAYIYIHIEIFQYTYIQICTIIYIYIMCVLHVSIAHIYIYIWFIYTYMYIYICMYILQLFAKSSCTNCTISFLRWCGCICYDLLLIYWSCFLL